ncbi:MAG: hypothetical protein OXH12_13645 [Chloroflexi bacterium]|nr:hypothetical protein [Chloroflexota bacterium]
MKWLDSLEKWLDSKWLDSMELEADLSRRRLLTGLALNLVTGVSILVVGFGARYLLGSNGLAIAVVIGYAAVYGTAGYLVFRYVRRRRALSGAPRLP